MNDQPYSVVISKIFNGCVTHYILELKSCSVMCSVRIQQVASKQWPFDLFEVGLLKVGLNLRGPNSSPSSTDISGPLNGR